jgi:hypothetical protein
MSPKARTWQALIHIWLQGDIGNWNEVTAIIAEARGTVLLIEALAPAPCDRVFVDVLERGIDRVRMIGEERG